MKLATGFLYPLGSAEIAAVGNGERGTRLWIRLRGGRGLEEEPARSV